MYHIVYLTTNLVNQKIYVGVHSTYNLDDGYLGSGNRIKYAIKKYGKENFRRDILYYCLTFDESLDLEEMIVDDVFLQRDDTYNLGRGGRGNKVHTDEAKLKMKRTFTDEHRKKLSESHKGKKLSDSHKNSIGLSNKGLVQNNKSHKKYWRDLGYSEDEISIIMKEFRSYEVSDETKKKIGDANRGRKWSEESKEKIKGRVITDEARRKISESLKGRKRERRK